MILPTIVLFTVFLQGALEIQATKPSTYREFLNDASLSGQNNQTSSHGQAFAKAMDKFFSPVGSLIPVGVTSITPESSVPLGKEVEMERRSPMERFRRGSKNRVVDSSAREYANIRPVMVGEVQTLPDVICNSFSAILSHCQTREPALTRTALWNRLLEEEQVAQAMVIEFFRNVE